MVEDGICVWDDIDLSVTEGPGMRWPFPGVISTGHLAGGKGGGGSTRSKSGAGGGTDGSLQAAYDSVRERYGAFSMDEMEHRRDGNLVRLPKGRTEPGG